MPAQGTLVMRAYTPTSLNTELGVLDFVIKVYRPCDRFPQGGKMSQVRRAPNQSALSTRLDASVTSHLAAAWFAVH